jgi:hypothetical protein
VIRSSQARLRSRSRSGPSASAASFQVGHVQRSARLRTSGRSSAGHRADAHCAAGSCQACQKYYGLAGPTADQRTRGGAPTEAVSDKAVARSGLTDLRAPRSGFTLARSCVATKRSTWRNDTASTCLNLRHGLPAFRKRSIRPPWFEVRRSAHNRIGEPPASTPRSPV